MNPRRAIQMIGVAFLLMEGVPASAQDQSAQSGTSSASTSDPSFGPAVKILLPKDTLVRLMFPETIPPRTRSRGIQSGCRYLAT